MKFSNRSSLASIQPGMKVLFAHVPADGHFNPLTGIAKHLQESGCDVRWYSSETYADKIARLNIPRYPFVRAKEITSENFDEYFPERKHIRGTIKRLNFDIQNIFIRRSTEYFDDITEIRKEFEFDVFIADVAFSAIPLVRELMKVPVVGIGVFPVTQTSRDLAPNGLGMTPATTWFGRIKQNILRYIADNVLFKPSNTLMQEILGSRGVDSGDSNLFDIIIAKSNLVLQSGTPSFEYKRSDLAENIRFVGPLLPYTAHKLREKWTSPKLKQYRKVILVTQGTVEKDVEKLLVPTLEAFQKTEYLVVATTGGSGTENLRSRFPDSNFIIEDYIPFGDIMPYADVYISNGGYGGVMLGIQNRLPFVVAGVHEGKNEINARIGYFKLGVNLKTETPSALQVKWAVDDVLSDPEYKSNVISLEKEFSGYDPNSLAASYIAGLLQKTSYLASVRSKFSREKVEYKIY